MILIHPLRWLRRLLLWLVILVVAYTTVTFVQVWMASRRDEAQSAQAIVVLGAAQYNGVPSPVLKARLDHALDLYEDGLAELIVVTGGGQPGDLTTEASAAAQYLTDRDVPESAIRREITSANTWQSLAAAARFLAEEEIDNVILVSSPYHSMRIAQIAGEVGLTGHPSPTRTSPEGANASFSDLAKETVAVGLGRVIGYRRLVNLDAQVDQVR